MTRKTPPLPAKRKRVRRRSSKRKHAATDVSRPNLSASAVRVRQVAGSTEWLLVHPRCASDRAEDIEEVRAMIDAGEVETAVDELRWLLDGCHDFIEAHKMLGDLAMRQEDLSLARGHYGIAYQLGLGALRSEGMPSPVPYHLAANRIFFEAGKDLVVCLNLLEKTQLAREVIEQLLKLDPTDPLEFKGLLASLGDQDDH